MFVYAPIVMIVAFSFNSNPINMMVWSGFTFDWYWTIFGYPTQLNEQTLYVESTDQLLAAVMNSLIVAASTTTISTVLGTMTALALYRYRFRAQRFYQGLLYMPMVMPDIVLGIALLVFFVSIGMSLGLVSIIIGHCTFLISYVFVVVSARLAGMDNTLEEASADPRRQRMGDLPPRHAAEHRSGRGRRCVAGLHHLHGRSGDYLLHRRCGFDHVASLHLRYAATRGKNRKSMPSPH